MGISHFSGPVNSAAGYQGPSLAAADGTASATIANSTGEMTITSLVATTQSSTTDTVSVLIGTIQTLTGAGAVDIITLTTKVVTTGVQALTLANGANGQLKSIVMITDGGDGTLTPTTKTGYTTILFGDVGDSVLLQYFTTQGWMIISNYGCTVA